MKPIKLHGLLAEQYGAEHVLDVANPAEAVWALSRQLKGFEKTIKSGDWAIRTKRPDGFDEVSLDTLDVSIRQAEEIHILPAANAAGIELIIIGGLALFAAVTAVFALSVKPPDGTDPNDREEDKNSFLFDGPVNVTEQGHPEPLIYGENLVGSIVVSAGLETTTFNRNSIPSIPGKAGVTVAATGGFSNDSFTADAQKGGKGGGSGGATEAPNSTKSNMVARIIDIISQGEIEGPALPGLQWVQFDEVPVENADGTFNHHGVAVAALNGLPDQDFVPGHGSQESTREVNIPVTRSAGAVEQTIIDPDVNRARVAILIPALFEQDTENGDITAPKGSNQPRIRISVQSNGGGFATVTEHTFSFKNNAPYQKDFNVTLPAGGAPWVVRVERLTADSEVSTVKNDTSWSFLTEIIDAKLSYPNKAYVALTVDAEQFGTSIPRRAYRIKGLRVEVPSNYDPIARTYTGIWDGTFKRAWTDNPAWVYYDLCNNKRYGLGRSLAGRIDKWGLYEIAQHCDGMVDNGEGGQEPRFTCNLVINKRSKAHQVLGALASAFRAMVFWSHSTIRLTQDAPYDIDTEVDKLLVPGNTVEGEFTYSGTSSAEKFSAFVVSWNDPEEGFRQNYEVVEDRDLIREIGWKPKEVAAFGCTSRGQANRLGRWLREDQKNSGVEYSVGPDFANARPGTLVQITDPGLMGRRWGGRLSASNINLREVTLDGPVDLNLSTDHFLSVVLPDGSVAKRRIVNVTGDDRVIALDGPDLPSQPLLHAVWSIQSDELSARLYRVTKLRERGTDEFKVSATFYDPTKFARVEEGISFDPPNYLGLPTGPILPPGNISIVEFLKNEGTAAIPSMLVSWEKSQDPRVNNYEVQIKLEGDTDEFEPLLGGTLLTREYRGVFQGSYTIRVRSVDPLQKRSAWKTLEGESTVGPSAALPEVLALQSFVSNDALQTVLTWVAPSDVRPVRYQILKEASGNFNAATILGQTDKLTFPVDGPGTYWVRTAFMSEVSANPPFVTVTSAQLPSAAQNIVAEGVGLEVLDPTRAAAILNNEQENARIDGLVQDAQQEIVTLRNDTQADLNTARTDLESSISLVDGRLGAIEPDVASNSSSITSLTNVTDGHASDISGIQAQINDPANGLNSKASIVALDQVDLDQDEARANAISALRTEYQNADSSLNGQIASEASTRANADTVLSNRTSVVEGQLNAPSTGVLARLTQAESTEVTNDTARATEHSELVALYGNQQLHSGSAIPDAGFFDNDFWNFPAGTFTFFDTNESWEESRGVRFVGGLTGAASDYFPMQPGQWYRVKATIYTSPNFSGWFQPFIHLPFVNFYSPISEGSTDVNAQSGSGFITGPNSGPITYEVELLNPENIHQNGTKNWQISHRWNISAGYAEIAWTIEKMEGKSAVDQAVADIVTNATAIASETASRVNLGTTITAAYQSADSALQGQVSTNASAIANETAARSQAIAAINARATTNPNILDNADYPRIPVGTGLASSVDYKSVGASVDWGLWGNNDWSPEGQGNLYIAHYNGGDLSGTYSDLRPETYFIASEFQDFIPSVYTGAHRCNVMAFIEWFNVSGGQTGTTQLNQNGDNNSEAGSGRSFEASKRLWRKVRPPAGTVRGRFLYRKVGHNGSFTSSFGFFHSPMVEVANADQTAPSAWSPGSARVGFSQIATEANILRTDLTTVDARLTAEENARSTAIELVTAKLGDGGKGIVPDAGYRDPAFWNPPAGLYSFFDTNAASGWKHDRAMRIGGGNYDFYSDYFPVEIGERYRIETQVYVSPDFAGNFTPTIHMPLVAWYGVTTGTSITPTQASGIGTFNNGPLGPQIYTFERTASAGSGNAARQWQFRYHGNITAGYVEISTRIFKIEKGAEIQTVVDALVSPDGSYARFRRQADVPGAQAFMAMEAVNSVGTLESLVAMGASSVQIFNQSKNGYDLALDVTGGRVTIHGDMNALGAMRFGNRRIPVALQSFPIENVSDGQVLDFGGDLTNIPDYTFNTVGLDALASGEEYILTLQNLTPTGATASLKISSTGTPVNLTATGSYAGGAGQPTRVLNKADARDATDGNYTFNCNVTAFVFSEEEGFGGDSFSFGEVNLEFFVRSGGVWQSLGTRSLYTTHNSTGYHTFTGTVSLNFADAIGNDGAHPEFGVSLGFGNENGESINSFTVAYQHTPQNSTRTATPNGRSCRLTVIPQNG